MSPERERKRKRDVEATPSKSRYAIVGPSPSKGASNPSITVRTAAPNQHLPILASVHGIELPENLSFNAYVKDTPAKNGRPSKTEYRLQAETDRIEYEATGEDDDGLLNYCIGVYDPQTTSVEIYPAPLLHVHRQVKRLKAKEVPERASIKSFQDQRHALSTAFGNKSSRKVLLKEQLNAINANSLGDIADDSVINTISSTVDEATASLPSRQSLSAGSGNSKYLPPLHEDEEGVTVDTVYQLHEMVNSKELEACQIYEWENQHSKGEESESTVSPCFVQSRIGNILESGTRTTQRLRLLRYIEHMIQFHRIFSHASQSTLFRGKIHDQMLADDRIITDSLIEKFTDAKDQVKSSRFVSKTKLTKLFCWLLILCLKVEDDSRLDLYDLYQDLQVDRKEMEMAAREIGAKVGAFPENLASAMGLTKAEAREHRLVRLALPLSFPKNKMLSVRKRK